METKVRHIRRADLDTAKWNACVERSFKPLVYGNAWYLDEICEHWDALVLGDYEAVMPLPWKEKWGIRYTYQPYFCQQLGIFSNIPGLHYGDFLAEIPGHFRLVELAVQSGAELWDHVRERTNLLVDLSRPYEEIRNGFNKDGVKNLQRLEKEAIEYTDDVSVHEVIKRYRETWGRHNPNIQNQHYARLEQACNTALKKGNIFMLKARDEHGSLAAALFLKNEHYLHYICAAPNTAGHDMGIMHGIIDQAIRAHAGQNMQLDLEGSDIPSVQRFYKKFGPVNEPYYRISINRLPWYVKWLRK